MKIDAGAVRNCLKSFEFEKLFREHLGWDRYDARLLALVLMLRYENRLCIIHSEPETKEPRIICSMGLSQQAEDH